MGPILIFLLSLYQLQTSTYSEVVSKSKYNLNSLTNNDDELNGLIPPETDADNFINTSAESSESNDDIPFVRTGHEQTQLEFRHPISSVNIDYSKNVIVLKFRKGDPRTRQFLEEAEKRKSLEDNFMRFGRAPSDFMRLGKRQYEEFPRANYLRGYYGKEPGDRYERSREGIRDSRGDNFMRFGKASKDPQRYERSQADFMRFGRSVGDFRGDFMRFGRSPGQDFMRFGRSPGQDFMRFGRSPGQDFMRFGRNPGQDFMRFGRNPGQDFMRFGRNPGQDFMRFGRAHGQKERRHIDKSFSRSSRPDNFMRFGRTPPETADSSGNFIRFGKNSAEQEQRNSTAPLQKSDIKETAKLLYQTDKEADESNPMDKAIKVLFSKQQQQKPEQSLESAEDDDATNENADLNLESDYVFNMPN